MNGSKNIAWTLFSLVSFVLAFGVLYRQFSRENIMLYESDIADTQEDYKKEEKNKS